MWKAGWAIVCLSFPCPSLLFWHNGTQTPREENPRAWGPVMILPCVLRSASTSAAFWGVNNGHSEWQCSLQGSHFSRTKYALAEAQVSRVSKWGRWTEHAQAETWTRMVADDWPEMPGNWLRSTSSREWEELVFFSTWSHWHKSLRSSWSREGLRRLLSPQVLRLVHKAKPSKSNPFHIEVSKMKMVKCFRDGNKPSTPNCAFFNNYLNNLWRVTLIPFWNS